MININSDYTYLEDKFIKNKISLNTLKKEKTLKFSCFLFECKDDIIYIRFKKNNKILKEEIIDNITSNKYLLNFKTLIAKESKNKIYAPNTILVDENNYSIEIFSKKLDKCIYKKEIKISKNIKLNIFIKFCLVLLLFFCLGLFVIKDLNLETYIETKNPEMNKKIYLSNNSTSEINLVNYYNRPIRLTIYKDDTLNSNEIIYQSSLIQPKKTLKNDYLFIKDKYLDSENKIDAIAIIEYLDENNNLKILIEEEIEIDKGE